MGRSSGENQGVFFSIRSRSRLYSRFNWSKNHHGQEEKSVKSRTQTGNCWWAGCMWEGQYKHLVFGHDRSHPGPRRCAARAWIRRSCPHTRVVLSTSWMWTKTKNKRPATDLVTEEQTSDDWRLTKMNSWRTARRSLWRNFSMTKISCYTVVDKLWQNMTSSRLNASKWHSTSGSSIIGSAEALPILCVSDFCE